MEEHLVSSLQKRYGLKPIVEEMLASCLTSVAFYEKEDVHVFVFQKILRFSLEEEFIKVLRSASLTVQMIYLHVLKSISPAKTEASLQIAYKQGLLGFIPLEIATKIVRFLYPPADSRILHDALESFAVRKKFVCFWFIFMKCL